MAPKFGTSGLRGLVSDLTDELVTRHIMAFVHTCDTGSAVCVGRDLRSSSPQIMEVVLSALQSAGLTGIDCGALPTPALALAAQETGAGAVMVTGSHIPADRNGLKFYTRFGEITKHDEEAIRAHLHKPVRSSAKGPRRTDIGAADRFAARYLDAFAPDDLAGRRIGLYAHSAVGQAVLMQILTGLGAEVILLGPSETFVPVDTEALDQATRARLRQWVTQHAVDALVSTDGDSDRPLFVDETGDQVPGDILGQITAEALGAEIVVTPVSSNSGVTQKGFRKVTLTRIGSPYVIAGMQAARGKVAGYEANGGFLLGFDAPVAAHTSTPLPPLRALRTRDCVLPIVMPLMAARGSTVSERVSREPAVVTAADRLQNIPFEASQRLISDLRDDTGARRAFLDGLGKTGTRLDLTDGLRMHLAGGGVLHIRPSGNAPELRIYTEGTDKDQCNALLAGALEHLRTRLGI